MEAAARCRSDATGSLEKMISTLRGGAAMPIVAALSMAVLAACTASTTGSGTTASTITVGGSQTIQVIGTAGNRFDPTTIDATPGKIAITMLVPGGTPHDFAIEGVVGSRIGLLSRGEKRTVTVNLAPGRYSFVCSIHSGMTGTLVVAAPTPASSP